MRTQTHTEEKFSLALDSIQGKRRIERVMEAAIALLDRYGAERDSVERLRLAFELIRRNFADETRLAFDDLLLETAGSATEGKVIFDCVIHGPQGTSGTLTATYTPPGSLGLTEVEWQAAMRLLTGIVGLGIGGHVTCP